MEDYIEDAQGEYTVVERLEALNSILGGIRMSMMTGDERFDAVDNKLAEWGSTFAEIKNVDVQIEVLREQIAELTLQMEKIPTVPASESNNGFEQKVAALSALMGDLRQIIDGELENNKIQMVQLSERIDVLNGQGSGEWLQRQSNLEARIEGTMNPEEILPQLDELRAHQEAIESRLNGFSNSVDLRQFAEMEDRQGLHQVRLQQLESAREELHLRIDGLSGMRDGLDQRLNEQGSVVGQIEVSLRDSRADLHRVSDDLGNVRQWIEGQESDWRQRVDALEHWRGEALDVASRMESEQSECKLQLDSLESKWSEVDERGRSKESELADSLSHLRMVLDGLAQRDVVGRARDAEFQRSIEELKNGTLALQSEMGEHQDRLEEFGAEVLTLRAKAEESKDQVSNIQVVHEESIGQVKLGQSRLEEELKIESEKRAEGMSRELVLARDHMEDQQRRIEEELDQLKKGQREIGSLREELIERTKENNEARREIRNLKEHLENVGEIMGRQRNFAFAGIAAAFLLSVGVTTILMPTSMPTVNPTAPAYSASSEQVDLIPLEAPVLAPEDNSTVVSVLPSSDYSEESEPEIESTVMSVTPAFVREASSSEVSAESASSKEVKYVVKDGDSLWKIAKKHPGKGSLNERIERIKKENQLEDVNIRPGKVLSISI